jgi:CheY-like chemotaxis protein
LNNGLTAVLGFSELALPLIPMESKAHHHIRHVIAATKKSRRLIQQLLAFSEQNDHNRCPLFLHVLVKMSLRFLRPAIPLWIELKAQIAHTTSPISANAVQMHEMMFYLIDSALRAMQQSGGTLDVQLQNRELGTDQIMPSGRLPAGRYVCLSVRGVGEGMGADKVGRWFTSFSTSNTFNEKQGVGLAVVSHIVSAHGGTLAVETHVGGGMTVSVYLPALSMGAPSTFEEDDPLPRGYESILFVDDEDAVVRFGKEVLESLGYHPVVCRTAAEAWDIFRVEPKQFDLLIIDRTMPGMSGDRLVRECRRLRPDLPVIFCSGSNDAPGLDDPCSRGFTEYLLKPLTLQELAYAIRRALDRSLLPPESTGSQASLGPEPSRRSIEVSNAVGPRG